MISANGGQTATGARSILDRGGGELELARVLVVDDEFDLRFILRLALENRGHEVEEAADGEHAIERLAAAERLPDIIVTDLHMPAVDGRALVARLRSDDATNAVPIVLWSSRPDRDLPVDAVVMKGPIAEVVEAVETIVGRATWNG